LAEASNSGTPGGKRQLPGVVKYLLLIAGAFVLGVLIFDLVIMPGITGKRDVVVAPALEGMSLTHAEAVCRRQHLDLVVAARRYSDEVPIDYVISQMPRAGASLKQGRMVRVVASDGRRMETVPELSGKSIREAESAIESAGLARGRTVRIFAPGTGQPSVAATSPSAGTRVPRGASVDLLVAMRGEPRSYLMPDLVGRDFPFAKLRLERFGFNVAHRVTKGSGGAYPNTIVEQSPRAGMKIREGETIELVVSASD
jgi:serine/threonine-protein kinase